MPIYEYKCKGCGKEFEVIQKFSDAPVKKCADCGGKVEKIISQSSFVLKGSGWYATDYGKKDKKKEEKPGNPGCSNCPSR
ncbi:MAG: zinc ribbon domain-containing protein [Deltaproteobacteria bacterium]|nr:zinc ribbon domain-containing protein [Deltaproteobacteria bacterium]